MLVVKAPHLEEHQGKASHRVARQHHGSILPLTESFHPADILVCQIDAAVEGNLAVDHKNFPVIPVVVMGGHNGGQGGKHLTLDAQIPQLLLIAVWQCRKLIGAVIQYPDIDSFLRLSGQKFQNLSPHQSLIDNEVFQKHILFRLFQLPQKFFPLGLTVGEVGHLRIVIHWMAAIAVDIVDQRCRTRIFLMQAVKGRRLLSQRILRHSDQLFDAEFQCPVSHLALGKPEQHGTKHMKQHDENKPGDFRGGIDLRVEKIDNHDHHKYGSTTVKQR